MADEAFALSPISARATQPSEADYDAIREAFMETSRGRWFLGEYAKRNRNADTRLVLDAVARIEETLAAQKQPSREPLDEALAALRGALGDAKDAAQAALHDLGLDEHLGPLRKGARVIREIAWRLREIGADGRICDLIDSQVSAIEGATARMAPELLTAALSRAFDLIEARIAAFDAEDLAVPPPGAASPHRDLGEAGSPGQARVEGAPVANPPSPELAAGADLETASSAAPAEVAASPQAAAVVGAADLSDQGEAEPLDAFTADDEAVLDRIALEMAAPDTDAAYEPPMEEMAAHAMAEAPRPAAAARPAAPPPAVETPAAAKKVEIAIEDIEIIFVSDASEDTAESPAAAPAAAPNQVARDAEPVAATPGETAEPIDAAPEAEAALSLGSSLLASGIVQRPKVAKPDPLAPIRRMSQSERIAFFS